MALTPRRRRDPENHLANSWAHFREAVFFLGETSFRNAFRISSKVPLLLDILRLLRPPPLLPQRAGALVLLGWGRGGTGGGRAGEGGVETGNEFVYVGQ